MKPVAAIVGVLSVLSASSAAFAQNRGFVVRNDGGSRVQFVSDAPLETITGVTSSVSGTVQADPANIAVTRGAVSMSVASLRTGVDLRDEHLRGASWLDAARFPNATFELVRVDGSGALAANVAQNVRIVGRLSLHGVTREVSTTARVRFVPWTAELGATPGVDGDVLRVQSTFSVRLTDFGVSVPTLVRLKVSNEIQVTVDLRAIAPRAGASR
jgi:polyisoprenoid-binding protein YceI